MSYLLRGRQAEGMETTDPVTTEGQPLPERRLLRRPVRNRMLTGVAAGTADYLGVDTNLVRIGWVVLAVVGPGILLYLAGLLLIPDEGSDQSVLDSLFQSLQSLQSR
jgi:phage shock protein PspC (stress-responsive transcriptional regulator)